jgi:hypothetical protein
MARRSLAWHGRPRVVSRTRVYSPIAFHHNRRPSPCLTFATKREIRTMRSAAQTAHVSGAVGRTRTVRRYKPYSLVPVRVFPRLQRCALRRSGGPPPADSRTQTSAARSGELTAAARHGACPGGSNHAPKGSWLAPALPSRDKWEGSGYVGRPRRYATPGPPRTKSVTVFCAYRLLPATSLPAPAAGATSHFSARHVPPSRVRLA